MNIKKYFEEFNRKFFFRLLIILIVIFLLRFYVYKGVEKFIISAFQIDEINRDINLDVLGIFIICMVVYYIFKLIFQKKLVPTLNSISNVILLTTFYFLTIRCSSVFVLEPFYITKKIKYLDVLFLLVLFLTTKFKYYPKEIKHPSINGFIEDNFNINNDILGRGKFAFEIGLKILDTKTLEKAFVIAVNSPWGFGKTAFLSLIEYFLFKKSYDEFKTTLKPIINCNEDQFKSLFINHQNTIIINYNPWKNFDDKKTVQDFFNEFSSSISQFDSSLSKNINKYSSYLSKLDDTTFSKIVETTTDLFKKDESLTSLFNEINSALDRIQKKIIVFVDDLDRLTGDELIDIIRLIRNTANFKNTFFVVAYDHNYVLNTINKKKLISAKEEYLKKIVQLEITLPVFNQDILIQFLNNELKASTISDFKIQEIVTILNEIKSINIIETKPSELKNEQVTAEDFFYNLNRTDNSIVFQIFQNLRDVIRFINSFKLSFESIGEIVDLYELLLLEFLKVKFLSIYQLISRKKFLTLKKDGFEFIPERFDEVMTKKNISRLNILPSDIDAIKTILIKLFNPTRKIFFRSVKYPLYYDMFFSNQAPEVMILQRLEAAMRSGIDDVTKIIDELDGKKAFEDLKNFFDSQKEFATKSDFEIILQTLFYLAKVDNIRINIVSQIRNILRDKQTLEKLYSDNKQELSDFLLSILKDKKYDFYAKVEIAGDELYKLVNKTSDEDITNFPDSDTVYIITNKLELQKILADYLDEFLLSLKDYDENIYGIYIKNLEDIESGSRKIRIADRANQLMKNFILNHKYTYFKTYLLREHPEPSFDGQYFHLDPFLTFYFQNDWNEIIKILNSPELKKQFENNEDEKKFYDFLSKAVMRAREVDNEKFLIKDVEEIETAEKFIHVVQRKQQSNLSSFFR